MTLFNAYAPQVLFQEVPDEVSLAFTMTGCPLRCSGCHSKDTWNPKRGRALSDKGFADYLEQYAECVTCVLFFGGEWNISALTAKLKHARAAGLKTCLYTGLDVVPETLKSHLTYLKTGPWLRHRGGLDQPHTNQCFLDLSNNKLINYKFQESHIHAAS